MSLRDFAAHLGISPRVVSRWEAGGEHTQPRPVNQAMLDTSLTRSDADVHERFTAILSEPHPAPSEPAPEVPASSIIRHPVDDKQMALIPAGAFLAGAENVVTSLDDYYLDIHPVTNREYARFVTGSKWPPPRHWENGIPAQGLADHPVVYVTWRDAHAYAAWAGKSLPTSPQWEKAARGTHGNTYPWGNQPTPAKCNVRDTGPGTTTPVDRYQSGVSPYGIYDLCGNTWEWCSTQSAPGRYELKGSAFTSPFTRATPSLFNDANADMLDDDTGFRCAALPHQITPVLES